jgi:tetratricopeptide (TPR) repeat protein
MINGMNRELNKKKTRQKVILLIFVFILYYMVSAYAYHEFQKKDIFFKFPTVDEKTNLERADQILAGKLSKALLWQEPVTYLYFSALKLLGFNTPQGIKFFQLFLLNPLIIIMIFVLANTIKFKYPLLVTLLYAISPLPLFLSLTLMKTLFTIFIYMLCLLLYMKFLNNKKDIKLAILFSLAWIIAWWTRQHIILFLPIFFYYLSSGGKEGTEQDPKEKRNIMVSLLVILLLIVSSLSFVTVVNKKQMFTLTSNGPINFYISNNEHYAKTINIWPGPEWRKLTHEIDNKTIQPYGMILGQPLKWGTLLAKKAYWEFTPYTNFRQFYWGYYENIFSYFKINWILTLLFFPLVIISLLNWKSLLTWTKAMGLIWLLFHAVNILLIPGIARYNAIILPVTIILALRGFIFLKNDKRWIILLIILGVGMQYSHSPNDFKEEYHEFSRINRDLNNGIDLEFDVPSGSKHPIEWKYLKARYEYVKKQNYHKVINIVKSVKDFNQYHNDFCQLLDFSYMKLGLYYDALIMHRLIQIKGYTEQRVQSIQTSIIYETEKMIQSYRTQNQLTPKKANAIALFLATLPPTNSEETRKRFEVLLNISEELIKEALEKSGKDLSSNTYSDTLGIIYTRKGLKEKGQEIFRQVWEQIQDPKEKEEYKKRRGLQKN